MIWIVAFAGYMAAGVILAALWAAFMVNDEAEPPDPFDLGMAAFFWPLLLFAGVVLGLIAGLGATAGWLARSSK